ncbi:MAG: hypothetical protein ACRC2T_05380 [Thermoguttaceae bacterium]
MKSHKKIGKTGILLTLTFSLLIPLGCNSFSPFKKKTDPYNSAPTKTSFFKNPFSKDKQPKPKKKDTFETLDEFTAAKRDDRW